MKTFLDSLIAILTVAVVVLVVALFAFSIGATFTGDGFTEWERDVLVGIVVALFAVLFTGRIVEILRGKD